MEVWEIQPYNNIQYAIKETKSKTQKISKLKCIQKKILFTEMPRGVVKVTHPLPQYRKRF